MKVSTILILAIVAVIGLSMVASAKVRTLLFIGLAVVIWVGSSECADINFIVTYRRDLR